MKNIIVETCLDISTLLVKLIISSDIPFKNFVRPCYIKTEFQRRDIAVPERYSFQITLFTLIKMLYQKNIISNIF